MEILSDLQLEEIRRLTIISIFSDDDLMEILVLKGGNALELAYKLNSRASVDIDVSMSKDFGDFDLTLEEVEEKIQRNLESTFTENGYRAFDIRFSQRPRQQVTRGDLNWGGYKIEFKIIGLDEYREIDGDIDRLRRESLAVAGSKKTFKIDISKHEYTADSKEADFGDYIIRVYTPRMIIFEKLRAICQQMPEYKEITRSNTKPRPRDFFDIHVIKETLEPNLDLNDPENLEMVTKFFEVKNVPLYLLNKIGEQSVRDFHAAEYASLEGSVKQTDQLKEFDFYYDYVVEIASQLVERLELDQSSNSLG